MALQTTARNADHRHRPRLPRKLVEQIVGKFGERHRFATLEFALGCFDVGWGPIGELRPDKRGPFDCGVFGFFVGDQFVAFYLLQATADRLSYTASGTQSNSVVVDVDIRDPKCDHTEADVSAISATGGGLLKMFDA